eukprot:jgi/Picsp_1/2289/NSC_05753-R1_---NA---
MVTAEELRLEFEARKWTSYFPVSGESGNERVEKRKHLEQALSIRKSRLEELFSKEKRSKIARRGRCEGLKADDLQGPGPITPKTGVVIDDQGLERSFPSSRKNKIPGNRDEGTPDMSSMPLTSVQGSAQRQQFQGGTRHRSRLGASIALEDAPITSNSKIRGAELSQSIEIVCETPGTGVRLEQTVPCSDLGNQGLESPFVAETPAGDATMATSHAGVGRVKEPMAKAISRKLLGAEGMTPGTQTPQNSPFVTPKEGYKASGGVMRDSATSSRVFIPSVDRKLENISGTELAEDMACNLVAGIFSMSDPFALPDQDKMLAATEEECIFQNLTQTESEKDLKLDQMECNGGTVDKSYFSLTDNRNLIENRKPASAVLRFPESCLFATSSPSGRYIALLLGNSTDREPREILVLEMMYDKEEAQSGIQILGSFGVQKTKYFPKYIFSFANFIYLCEDKRRDPVLLISAALELTDNLTQTGLPCLHVVPCGNRGLTSTCNRIISIENDIPIVFMEVIDEEKHALLVSGLYPEDGLLEMKFDVMWQSFAWGKKWLASSTHAEFISKGQIMKIRVQNDSVGAILASDREHSNLVISWPVDRPLESKILTVFGAEAFAESKYWNAFINATRNWVKFCGVGIDVDSENEPIANEIHDVLSHISLIYASKQYIVVGAERSQLQIWNLAEKSSRLVKNIRSGDREDSRVTSICQTRIGEEEAVLVAFESGDCALLLLDHLFSLSRQIG